MEPPKPDAVIFDLDGVLADSEALHLKAWQVCLQSRGVEAADLSLDPWVGVADTEIVLEVIARFGLSVQAPVLLEEKRQTFGELVRRQIKPFPGLEAGLRALAKRLPLAVATSSHRREARIMLSTLGILDPFQVIVAGDEVERRKPAPDGYLLAATRLGMDPGVCLAVEDSPGGIRAARSAGMAVFAVGTSFSDDRLAEADRVFASPAEAIRAIETLTAT